MHDTTLRVLIVDENPVRAAILEAGLREAGFTRLARVDAMDDLPAKVGAIDPDVILIDLENPSRDTLEHMFQVSREVRRPIAMFVDQSDANMIAASVDAGVSAYVVDGLRKERVRPILDLTISRFRAFARLRDELDEARAALEERKLIERAKGILMKQRGLSEEAAYQALRRTAMNQKRKLVDVALGVVTAAPLLE